MGEDELIIEARAVLVRALTDEINSMSPSRAVDISEAVEAFIDVKIALLLEMIADRFTNPNQHRGQR